MLRADRLDRSLTWCRPRSGASTQRTLGAKLRDADGAWFGSAALAGFLSVSTIPRKLSGCQFVVGAGELQCFNPAAKLGFHEVTSER